VFVGSNYINYFMVKTSDMNWYLYKCCHCGKTVTRQQDGEPKKWIKSYCETVGKTVHLMLVDEEKEVKNG